ncbi:MAG: hypothetical protein CVU71_08340 [Deltaproteobacteria bacterium HGW-Deltaproteobacteria-6]|nr:MAG: hypothetical protein CVU71_08340 [Deltaproteobacteria bacterium HGW-Deltaproteobacteria-6]
MNKFLQIVAVFCLAGLAGPLLRLVTWPTVSMVETSPAIYGFFYTLVLLLWPAQLLAVMEVSIGTGAALALAVGANLLLFSTFGLIAGLVSRWRSLVFIVYVFVCSLVSLFEWWGAGYNFAYFHWVSFVVALLVYSVPFCGVVLIANRKSAHEIN